MKDQSREVSVRPAVSPTRSSNNAAIEGAIIDCAGFDAVTFAIQVGAMAAAAPTLTPTLHHGAAANLSDAEVVPAAQLVGTIAGATFSKAAGDANKAKKIGYIGTRRYVRLTLTPAANDDPLDCSALAILGQARALPVAA